MAKSIRNSTAKARNQAKINQLNNLGTSVDDLEFSDVMTPLEGVIGDFILRVQENINNEKNFVTTGKISDITMKAENGGISVFGSPHLIYQDRGVSGTKKKYNTPHSYLDKKPPLQPFLDWVKAKQIFLTEKNDKFRVYDMRLSKKDRTKDRPVKELTDDQKRTNAAYAMRESVFQDGIEPKNIYEKEIPQLVDELAEVIANFSVQYILQQIDINPRAGGGKRIIIK